MKRFVKQKKQSIRSLAKTVSHCLHMAPLNQLTLVDGGMSILCLCNQAGMATLGWCRSENDASGTLELLYQQY